ncbi:hypothetical protein DM02DRAFT_725835 [Periconia macrospinosa]|uniref:Uncharacterized protein n=1 Tax=Periconia macrospinosa TaxID=97972 RepID=A0A2V1E2G5_9PLEO|nr:hypothetical protein DM02DRAFT_725835 [Periconia macrospinosa]
MLEKIASTSITEYVPICDVDCTGKPVSYQACRQNYNFTTAIVTGEAAGIDTALSQQLIKHGKTVGHCSRTHRIESQGFEPQTKSRQLSTMSSIPAISPRFQNLSNRSYQNIQMYMNLRKQLEGTDVKIIELTPPVVVTHLHQEREDPDDNKKEKIPQKLTVDEFVDEVTKKVEGRRYNDRCGLRQYSGRFLVREYGQVVGTAKWWNDPFLSGNICVA